MFSRLYFIFKKKIKPEIFSSLKTHLHNNCLFWHVLLTTDLFTLIVRLCLYTHLSRSGLYERSESLLRFVLYVIMITHFLLAFSYQN